MDCAKIKDLCYEANDVDYKKHFTNPHTSPKIAMNAYQFTRHYFAPCLKYFMYCNSINNSNSI